MGEYMAIPVEEFERLTSQNEEMQRFVKLVADRFWVEEDYEQIIAIAMAIKIKLERM